MDAQHSEKPHSHTSMNRTSSARSQNSRTSSHISELTKNQAYMKVPQNFAQGDRQRPPTTILLYKSQTSQATLMPKEHRTFIEEAYNKAICFKLLRDLSSSDSDHLRYTIKKIKSITHGAPNLVLETIGDYFVNNQQISTRHKFRLFHVLEAVLGASESLEETWEKAFTQLALENMSKSTPLQRDIVHPFYSRKELEEAYQDAASNVLVAICRHSWQAVAQRLETEVLSGIFPHRSRFYVMGIMTLDENLFKEGEKAGWEEQLTKMAVKSVPFLNTEAWSKELLGALTRPDQTQQEQPPEKAFLFIYYGLILQASENGTTVRTHLKTLLETSHQRSKQREGIALTVGLAAARHLDHVWAVLRQFGSSTPVKWSLNSFSPKNSEDLRWKWASSTILLAYGQMADKAKAHILPWVDNILSRMVYFFHYSSWDETLKQSFLTAILMLVGAISRNEGTQSYEFSQVSKLLECLMLLIEKEPQDMLCTTTRQQTLNIISSLCKLRPPLDLEQKSRLLSISLRSVMSLPQLEVLEKHTCLFLEPPNIQTLYKETAGALEQMLQNFIMQNPTAEELHFLLLHLYVWLASEKAHERQRAVHSCMALLKFLSHNLYLDPKEDFKRIGQLVGMLGILCQDPDKTTQCSSLEAVAYLYKLVMHQRGGKASQEQAPAPQEPPQANKEEAMLWSGGDQEAAPPGPREVALSKDHVLQPSSSQVKDIMKHLTTAELTDLIWTAVNSLGSTSPFRVQAAADMLLTAIQEHGAKLETVASLGQAIHLQLCSVRIPQARENALQAITLLARNHTSELVAAFLDFSISLDSHTFRLWRALGAEQPMSHRVLAALLGWLQKRPLPTRTSSGSPQPKKKAYLHSLAAMNTLHELQFACEFKQAMQEAFPELLLALLSQTHYLLELNLPEEPQPGKEAQETALLGPQSMSLEALKSLLSTTRHWQDFAHMELQGAWDLFATTHTYPQGVGLLARAMVQNQCRQIKALTLQLLPNLRSREERDRKVAIIIFTEFLYSPTLLEVLPKEAALSVLVRSLRDPSPEIRVLGLQGLGNILFHPEKGSLLRGQLPPFLRGFFQSSEPVLVHLIGTVSEALHRLGAHSTETLGLRIAINTRAFFDDERDGVRAAAMALFGELVASVTGQKFGGLRTQVHQSMVPLLLHLKDRCPAVVTQAKFAFYHCSVLLQWRLPHTLFCTLAWEKGLSARHFLWSCLMSHSQDEFSTHLAQALSYLHRRHHHLKIWAALFIGYTICYYPQAVSQTVSDVDKKLLVCTFEDLKKNPEPSIQYFASRQASFLQKVVARPQ